jgi:hypothetical protein
MDVSATGVQSQQQYLRHMKPQDEAPSQALVQQIKSGVRHDDPSLGNDAATSVANAVASRSKHVDVVV